MIVEAHDSRNYRVAGQIQHLGAPAFLIHLAAPLGPTDLIFPDSITTV